MKRTILWRAGVIACALLIIAGLLIQSPWRHPLGSVPLFQYRPTPQSVGVYGIALMAGFTGVGRSRGAVLGIAFVVALVASIADARFALLLAIVAPSALVEARAK